MGKITISGENVVKDSLDFQIIEEAFKEKGFEYSIEDSILAPFLKKPLAQVQNTGDVFGFGIEIDVSSGESETASFVIVLRDSFETNFKTKDSKLIVAILENFDELVLELEENNDLADAVGDADKYKTKEALTDLMLEFNAIAR